MIEYEDVLSFNFYTYGQAFSGSYKGMRYRLIQLKEKKDEEGKVLQEQALEAYVWPEPFSFEKTADDQKVKKLFPFNDEGRRAAVDWMNEFYQQNSWEEGFTMSGISKLLKERAGS